MPFWKHRTEEPWSAVFSCLAPGQSYAESADRLLALSEWPLTGLYWLDRERDRFVLEHLRDRRKGTPPAERSSGEMAAAPLPVASAPSLEEESALPLSIPSDESWTEARWVSTAAGSVFSLPLRDQTGQVVGLLQVGPAGGNLSRAQQRRLQALAPPLAHAFALLRAWKALVEELGELQTRMEISQQMLRSTLDLEDFIALLLDLAIKATRSEAGFVAIGTHEGPLTVQAAQGLPDGFLEQVNLTPDEGLFAWLPETRSLVVHDVAFVQAMGVRAIVAVPLVEGERVLGVFALLNLQRPTRFDAHTLRFLEIFADQIRLMLANNTLLEDLKKRYIATLHALARALDARYPYTEDHHRRVAQVALAVAREMGLKPEQQEHLRIAALGHDVGMCGIVEAERGFRADFHHPVIGAQIFDALSLDPEIGETIASHHEWYDGWGFPQGLKGEEIPLTGRILALAEFVVEAITDDPVRPGLSSDRLASALKRRRGTQFDPQVVDAYLRIIGAAEGEMKQQADGTEGS